MIKLEKVTLNSNNELADLIGSSPIGIKMIAFQKISYIYKFCKNEIAFEIA